MSEAWINELVVFFIHAYSSLVNLTFTPLITLNPSFRCFNFSMVLNGLHFIIIQSYEIKLIEVMVNSDARGSWIGSGTLRWRKYHRIKNQNDWGMHGIKDQRCMWWKCEIDLKPRVCDWSNRVYNQKNCDSVTFTSMDRESYSNSCVTIWNFAAEDVESSSPSTNEIRFNFLQDL